MLCTLLSSVRVQHCCECAQAEENALRAGRTRVADGAGGWPTWNHVEFRVRYASLANQLCVAGIYVKLLLDGLDQVSHCLRAHLCCTAWVSSTSAWQYGLDNEGYP